MMVAPLRKPYLIYENNALFLNSLSYIGFISIPQLTPVYP
jgi:hypothetical protein